MHGRQHPSPMLQTAGTTVRSRRKLFNRLRSISPFSFPQRLPSQTRTRLPIVSTAFGSTPPHPPSGFVPLLGYSYHPFSRLAPYCYGTPPPATLLHGRTPRLRSVVVLHCFGGRCQRLGSDCNVLPSTLGFSRLWLPLFLHSLGFPVVLSSDLDRVSFVILG